MKKILKRTLTIVLILTLGMIKNSLATTTVDMIPPEGNATIVNSTITNGVNYVDDLVINLKISAADDVTSAANLKMYITTTPDMNKNEIPDEDWETYATSKQITLPKTKETSKIYVFFKDEAGNVSEIFNGEKVKYNLVYDANGGENAPASQESYFGMSIKVTEERPTYDGKYFLGWSTSKTATVASYTQGTVITADSFKGANKDITLYAVWTSDVNDLPSLADKVKIGDYVNYPVAYEIEELNSFADIINKAGWRVFSKDVDLNGRTSKGTVNLVSAGIPIMYNNMSSTSALAVSNLGDSFLKTKISNSYDSAANAYTQKGFLTKGELTDLFTNKYTALDSSNNPIVRSLNLNDVAGITGLKLKNGSLETTPTPTADGILPIKTPSTEVSMSLKDGSEVSAYATIGDTIDIGGSTRRDRYFKHTYNSNCRW